jgi:hypothetical protein
MCEHHNQNLFLAFFIPLDLCHTGVHQLVEFDLETDAFTKNARASSCTPVQKNKTYFKHFIPLYK